MITIKFDWNPNELEKALYKAVTDKLKDALTKGGVRGVTVTMKKKGSNVEWVLSGPEDQVRLGHELLSKGL